MNARDEGLPSDGDIVVGVEDAVATVTFNRPQRRNAIDYDGWLALRLVAEALAGRADIRIVVFAGEGDDAFSAGADIADFDRHRNDSEEARVYGAAFDGAVDAIGAIPQPTVCLIKGACIGGGCELSLAADIRIAADNGRFGIPAARLGILIGHREMGRLVGLVGRGNASYLLLTCRLIGATEALRIGLVNAVLPLAEVDEYVYAMAAEIASLAPLSHLRHKQIMETVLRNPSLEELTAEQEDLPFSNFDSEDFHEGRRAFMDRRPPQFHGL